ncbi:MAG: integrase [Castellaniella sp.]|uniref:integrase n=1 Tax=Castellaniella sp. TaxID=1955812 RepID=UPI003C7798CF
MEGYTDLAWPAVGMERSWWKNKEKAREVEITDDLLDAVYAEADQILLDALDIATATGYGVTDVRLMPIPTDGKLRNVASKTGKRAEFEVAQSPVLSAIVARRQAIRADHVMPLSTPTGRPVTYNMLRSRWESAREMAAEKHPEMAEAIRSMYLRDMRKRASDLADSDESASKLLQHSSVGLTRKHYRTRATKLKAVR